ncbi:MAG TPA: PEPxxWA-CTERM sorting domain-containing protein [Rhizomicrobium sp.]|nr:PEPxxWA-CTERM sorting domain-containing protein [Rhizomicrobium sp.]
MHARLTAAFLVATALCTPATAASFHITSGTAAGQTLNAAETGQVDLGASVVGAGTVGVTFGGTGASLTNDGTISSATNRALDSSYGKKSNITLSITNTGTITSSAADAFRLNNDRGNGTITVINSGTISETGSGGSNGQAIDFAGLTSSTGTTTITNQATGVIWAADADAVRPGTNATVNNYGQIYSLAAAGDSGNDGVDFQDTGTGTVNNYATGSIIGARHGITGDLGATIYNEGTILGSNGSGLNFDTKPTVTMTVTNKGTITGTAVTGDGDGIDVDGLVTVNNYGTINTKGIFAGEINEALAIGGGTVNNYAGGNIESVQRAITVDDSNKGNAFGSTTIYNEGTIKGDDGEAINITSTFDNTLTNKGTIVGSTVMGAGHDTINLYTGSSEGSLDGGAGNDEIHLKGTGTGTLSNVSNVETLDVDSGAWAIKGSQSYSAGITVASGATASVSGTLSGNVTNNGTVKVEGTTASFDGTFQNNGAYVSDPSTQSFNNLSVGQPGYIQAGTGDKFLVAGNFIDLSTADSQWHTSGAIIDFTGAGGTSHTFELGAGDGWNQLVLDDGNVLVLSSSGAAYDVLHLSSILGADIVGDLVTNIQGVDGLTIIYDARNPANAALGGLSYDLTGGGRLVASVPEPAGWALMIAGVGVMGAMLRRRTKLVAA